MILFNVLCVHVLNNLFNNWTWCLDNIRGHWCEISAHLWCHISNQFKYIQDPMINLDCHYSLSLSLSLSSSLPPPLSLPPSPLNTCTNNICSGIGVARTFTGLYRAIAACSFWETWPLSSSSVLPSMVYQTTMSTHWDPQTK